MRNFVLLAAVLVSAPALAQQPIDGKVQARIDRILKKTPLIDCHNDIAEQLPQNHGFSVSNLASGTDNWPNDPLMTDMARLHAGRVGGQFWSVYIEGTYTGDEAIRRTIDQIDIVDRMIAAYPNDLERALTADDLVREDAVAADLTGAGWPDPDPRVVPVPEAEAGRRLARLAAAHTLTLFEYWLTDKAGHAQDAALAGAVLDALDRFFGGLLDALDPATLLVVSSDHGNLEDLATKGFVEPGDHGSGAKP
jgi:hypothetical protein